MEFIPKQKHRLREWKPGNNPFSALKEFLIKNKRLKIDQSINNKLLLSCNPEGYLVAKN